MTAVQAFSEFGASVGNEQLSEQVIHHAKRAVIDWYAAPLPGAAEAPATLFEQLLPRISTAAAPLALGRCARLAAQTWSPALPHIPWKSTTLFVSRSITVGPRRSPLPMPCGRTFGCVGSSS